MKTTGKNDIKILLVDDQHLFVECLKLVIEKCTSDIEIVGISYNAVEALSLLERQPVDIVLLDIVMPDINGVECTKIIHEKYPNINVVMLTTFDDSNFVFDALSNGATGYLLKDISPYYLIDAIYSVYNGGMLISPAVARKLLMKIDSDKKSAEDDKRTIEKVSQLTHKERAILTEIAKGKSNKEIAASLFVSEQTIKNHTSTIYSKLEVQNRAQALLFFKEKMVNMLDKH